MDNMTTHSNHCRISEPAKGCNPMLVLTNKGVGALNMAVPTQARACAYFNYDPETGLLHTRERDRSEFSRPENYTRHIREVGKPRGCPKVDGYVKVCIDGAYYSAHRVAWLIMTGEWVIYPAYEIDHINGDRADNRWSNLRKVTKSENQRNAGQRINNTSGVHGVNWKPKRTTKEPNGGRWVARIWNGPRHVYLGTFRTLYEASIARKAAERVLGFTGTDRPASE